MLVYALDSHGPQRVWFLQLSDDRSVCKPEGEEEDVAEEERDVVASEACSPRPVYSDLCGLGSAGLSIPVQVWHLRTVVVHASPLAGCLGTCAPWGGGFLGCVVACRGIYAE